jgi:hypothetical protein
MIHSARFELIAIDLLAYHRELYDDKNVHRYFSLLLIDDFQAAAHHAHLAVQVLELLMYRYYR